MKTTHITIEMTPQALSTIKWMLSNGMVEAATAKELEHLEGTGLIRKRYETSIFEPTCYELTIDAVELMKRIERADREQLRIETRKMKVA